VVTDGIQQSVRERIITMDTAADDLPPQAARLAPKLRALADQGIYFGTSSWKYEGCVGTIYCQDRYLTRGKFSKAKFEAACLAEYAQTFPAVGGDFPFYQFPTPDYWAKLFESSPPSLLFGLKVPENITVAKWPGHARYGKRAGQANDAFLICHTGHRQPAWKEICTAVGRRHLATS
jgi:Protein of unknown function DUF72